MTHHTIRTGDLLGKTVIDQAGKTVGTVDDIQFDPDTWRVDTLLLTLDRDAAGSLGERKPMFGNAQLNVRTEHIRTTGDVVILNGTLEEMARSLDSARTDRRS